ncbi:MAG: hypothetical protein MPW16_21395 (plasmid) [Candidatus Manganitrophus sp.]|nr:MAG: hypothetical protein MPW16_21395 [Candidatus Manganitrophus sp.]
MGSRNRLAGCFLALLVGCSAADDFQGCVIPAVGRPSLVEVERAFLGRHPQFGFREVKATAIPGLFEVDTEENTFYFYPESGHLLVGTLYPPDEIFSEASALPGGEGSS